MDTNNRFQDENLLLSNFYNEVIVECGVCTKKAVAILNQQNNTARMFCNNCGYNKEHSMLLNETTKLHMPAHTFFKAQLWLTMAFKNDFFYAYNYNHLNYLERYISATLREHKDRSHFTLLEKLPKFYHEGKNRSELLKIIAKLKSK